MFGNNKISNILGTQIPIWLLKQLNFRSAQNAQDSRDNSNLLYLANKSAWVRLVSSVNIINQSDKEYFKRIIGDVIKDDADLAKQFVLFGGTSKYLGNNSYGLRSGIGKDAAYSPLGTEEIQKYGYRPMPGINSVTVETLGKLGSLRQATINFKCWDKMQLDIIDTLYFKLGFTMFLEWGNTFFYSTNEKTYGQLLSSELYSIDPFKQNLTKEEIAIQISKNNRDSEGNYDALLGLVTNFNFSYNQDGGYDCTIRLTGLGILGDSIKINNPSNLPNILAEEIKRYNDTLSQIATAEEKARKLKEEQDQQLEQNKKDQGRLTLEQLLTKSGVKYNRETKKFENVQVVSYPGDKQEKPENADLEFQTGGIGSVLVIQRLKGYIPIEKLDQVNIVLDSNRILSILNSSNVFNIENGDNWEKDSQFFTIDAKEAQRIVLNYKGVSGKDFGIRIDRQVYAKPTSPEATDKLYQINDKDFAVQLKSVLANAQSIKLESVRPIQAGGRGIADRINGDRLFFVTIGVPFTRDVQVKKIIPATVTEPQKEVIETVKGEVTVRTRFQFEDSSFVKSFTIGNIEQTIDYEKNQAAIAGQNQQEAPAAEETNEGQDASVAQIKQALESQSSLELTLRTIQVHALNKAINDRAKQLDIGRLVYPLNIADEKDTTNSGVAFYKQIFSNGIFSDIITDLINDTNINPDPKNPKDRFKFQAKYGFATELMAGREEITQFQGAEVNFKELLKAYVVPYEINQEIIKGTSTNHPVYIPLGLLLMILNHNCTIYDTKDTTAQTPLVYIDFNPNLNFFLSNKKHLSTNPWVTLIRYEGDFSDYTSLFSKDILTTNQTAIAPLSGSKETTPLFNTPSDDLLSSQIPPIKFDNTTNNVYRGKLMNILLNMDYIVKLVRDYSLKDGSNNIYLKNFIEQILSDINKYLGNFNKLRLSYNDGGNTYQVVDDQVVPPLDRENILEPDNNTNLPLVGKFSIAKNLEIKTDISSKLSNMIAISANADVQDKATLSTNGDNFGFINTSYKDRYVPIRGDVQTNTDKTKVANLDAVKTSAIQFNQSISDFYSKINPSEANVSHATNYYIEKMSKIKNDEYPTRASTMIPVSVNFVTDGVSGFTMGQGFTIPDELLPYTYNNRVVANVPGLNKDHINKVGFVVVGLTNTIENNQWNTSVKANMIFLKNATEFTGSVNALAAKDRQFGGVSSTTTTTTQTTGGVRTSYPELPLLDPPPAPTTLSYSDAKKKLGVLTDADTAKSVFAILWAEAAKSGNSFSSAGGFNYAGVQTDAGRWGGSDKLIKGRFVRRDSERLREFAQFTNDDDFLSFMISRVKSKNFTASNGNRWTERYLNSWVFLNLESQDPNKYKQLFPSKLAIFDTAINRYNKA